MRRNTSTGRNLGMLLGGVAAGIVGSRLIPPLVAAVNGSGRVRAGGDPFAVLVDDHRRILETMGRMLTAESRLNRARLFLMLKRKLAKHALAEEDIVYPIVHQERAEADRSKHLYDEHADMKILLYELEQRVKTGENWNDAVGTLRSLIQRHVDEEERIVFPSLRQRMSQAGLPELSGQISREEALIV